MPPSGGSSDKLGNRYEALWAIDRLLHIVDGAAHELTLESLDPDESRGIEFVVVKADGTTAYWSVKRQTTKAAGWTLGLLAAKYDRGRSILGDLLRHVERDPAHLAVFASTLGAGDFEELRAFAETEEIFEVRLGQSRRLKAKFEQHILPLCGNDIARARSFLLHTQTHAADEARLCEEVHFKIRKLFYAEDGSLPGVDAVRGHLADLLLARIHRPIRRQTILDALAIHGVRLRDWAIDATVRGRVGEMCDIYAGPLRSRRINGALLPLADFPAILDSGDAPSGQKVLVVGGAGSGKSTTLAGLVEFVGHLRADFDHLDNQVVEIMLAETIPVSKWSL